MSEPQAPPPGTVMFFDAARPPLAAGEYRVDAQTEVSFDGETQVLAQQQRIDVVAPRFALAAHEVVGVVPPPNAEGAFENVLPQVMLRRRTLPWERPLDPSGRIADPPSAPGDPPALGAAPWLALLLFDESECTILRSVPLSQVVPADVLARLGAPGTTSCDAVEAPRELLASIVPTKQELALLAHVRLVNVDDRELAGTDDDGWIAVVVGNRLPTPTTTSWACLVSLEERADVVAGGLPEVRGDRPDRFDVVGIDLASGRLPSLGLDAVLEVSIGTPPPPTHRRLVLLHAWRFTCGGAGTFADLMRRLDVGMLGTPTTAGQPTVTDTGHVPISLHTRSGVVEQALYRGPLVPFPLTRDPLGPYHSADQARRVVPEAGMEDIGPASAFELGRLLAASDPRFAEEALQWRRSAVRRSVHRAAMGQIERMAAPPDALRERLETAPSTVSSIAALRHVVAGSTRRADVRDLRAAAAAVGLDPTALADAWQLASPDVARDVLRGDVLQPGSVVPPTRGGTVGLSPSASGSLEADRLGRISAARDAVVANRIDTEDE